MSLVGRFVGVTFRHPRLVGAAVVAVVVGGIWSLHSLPVEAFPDLTNQQVVVITEAPGLAAADVEQWITYPIEAAVMGIPGTQQVRSLSKFALSMVTVVFEGHIPIYFARQQVAERRQRCGRVCLPVLPPASARSPRLSARCTSTW